MCLVRLVPFAVKGLAISTAKSFLAYFQCSCTDTHLACRSKHSHDDQNQLFLSAPGPKGVVHIDRVAHNHGDSEADEI